MTDGPISNMGSLGDNESGFPYQKELDDFERWCDMAVEQKSQPHDPRKEQITEHPYVMNKLGEILDEISDMVNDILTTNDNEGVTDTRNQALQSIITKLEEKPTGLKKTTKVLLTGRSGHGKSMLANAVLGVQVARTDGREKTCTQITTHFEYLDNDGYTISINFWTVEEFRTVLKDMHQEFRRHDAAFKDPKNKRHMHYTRDRLLDFFEVITEHRDTLPKLCDKYPSSEETDAGILEELFTMAEKRLVEEVDIGAPNTFQTVKEMHKHIDQLGPNDGKFGTWVYVKNVVVGFRCEALRDGLVIIDTPGLMDGHPFHAQRVRMAIRDSDIELLVSSWDRINSDTRSLDAINAMLARRDSHQFAIAISEIDKLGSQRARQNDPETEYISHRKKLVTEQGLRHEIEPSKSPHCLGWRDYWVWLKGRQEARTIHINSQEITANVVEKYMDKKPVVKALSAMLYLDWLECEPRMLDLPALDPQQTGIPALRSWLRQVTLDRKLQAATEYAQDVLPAITKLKSTLKSHSENDQHTCAEQKNILGRMKSLLDQKQPVLDRLAELLGAPEIALETGGALESAGVDKDRKRKFDEV